MLQNNQLIQSYAVKKSIDLLAATKESSNLTWRIGCYCSDCNAAREIHLVAMDIKPKLQQYLVA